MSTRKPGPRAMLVWGGIVILIIVAGYLLLLRPALDTNEDEAAGSVDGGSSPVEKSLRCVQDAGGDPKKLQECASR